MAIIALVCFVLCAFGINTLGPIALLPLGLAFLAVALLWPWNPFARPRA